jgi:diguanylate cyclase (GGDEF)-like protein/PAS domain S-box-containing protein
MTDPRPAILAIDDTPANLSFLGAALAGEFHLQIATSGQTGLSLALKAPPDLILLDVMMPGMDGFETCRRMKREAALRDIPIIFVTALSESSSEEKGLALGAADYITKPFNVGICRQRIRNLLERESLRKEIETQRDLLQSALAERRKAEEMVGLLSVAVEQAPVSVVITDLQGRVQYVNPHFSECSGYPAAEAIGQNPRIFQSGQTPPHVYRQMWRRLLGGQSWKGTFLNRRKNGEHFWEEAHIAPAKNPAGTTTHYVAVKLDISQRKQAEDEMRIAAIAFSSQNGIVITNARGVILRVNPAFTRLTGYSDDEARGKTPAMLKSDRHAPAFYQRMWETIQETGSWQGAIWNRRKDGKIHAEMLSIKAVVTPDRGTTHYVGSYSDITSDKEAEAEIHRLAYYDPLTSLPNRRLLQDRMGQALAASRRSKHFGALFLIDLDDFKTLNDTRGHALGDELLSEVARRLREALRERDTVARQGGDEFVVLTEEMGKDIALAATLAEQTGERLCALSELPFVLSGQEYQCKFSIGVALFQGSDSISDLLRHADLALYQAKRSGRNALRFFDPVMQLALNRRTALLAELRQAIGGEQLRLYYQPQLNSARQVVGAEALLRWQHPRRGLVQPNEFIPLAEETGLIVAMGQWALETACAQLKAWEGKPETGALTVAVNVSVAQFRQDGFVEQVLSAIEQSGANPRRLKLELTESVMVSDIEDIIAKMMSLKEKGISFSLDDFGTGYSSLAYLKRLPIEQLKIDQSFVRGILDDANDAAIARMVIVLAGSLGLNVIAEGVETQTQCEWLVSAGCHHFQGYLFGRPLALEQFEAFVANV